MLYGEGGTGGLLYVQHVLLESPLQVGELGAGIALDDSDNSVRYFGQFY